MVNTAANSHSVCSNIDITADSRGRKLNILCVYIVLNVLALIQQTHVLLFVSSVSARLSDALTSDQHSQPEPAAMSVNIS